MLGHGACLPQSFHRDAGAVAPHAGFAVQLLPAPAADIPAHIIAEQQLPAEALVPAPPTHLGPVPLQRVDSLLSCGEWRCLGLLGVGGGGRVYRCALVSPI